VRFTIKHNLVKRSVFVYNLHAYMFVDHTVFMTFGHSKLVRQQKCNY